MSKKPPARRAAHPAPTEAPDRKARAKEVLQALLIQADLYPEFAAHLEPAVEALRAETKRTTRSTRDRILILLEPVTGLTFGELHEDLLIPEDDLWNFLRELAALGLIEQVQTGRRIDPNKGRTEHLFKLSHSSPTGDSYNSPAAGASATRATMDALSD
jgi:hypothetical protein